LGFKATTAALEVVQLVDDASVMSCVEPSLKLPTAWNCSEQFCGTEVGLATGQGVSIGVALALAVELGIGVAGAVPGHTEICSREGPGGPGSLQATTGTPDELTTHGVVLLLPQLHENAPATSIIAAPIRIQRALPFIGM
jgi:hypothetical protein